MISQPLRSMLGLCQRAGGVASGDLAAEQALKKGKACLLVLAEDASERTQTKFAELAARTRVPCYRAGTRDELGAALGKAHRAAVVVQSRDFAKGIIGILDREDIGPDRERG